MPCKCQHDEFCTCIFAISRIVLCLDYSVETVLYLNLRIGRESMNRPVLTSELTPEKTSTVLDDISTPGILDYRQVPLIDVEE